MFANNTQNKTCPESTGNQVTKRSLLIQNSKEKKNIAAKNKTLLFDCQHLNESV